MKPLVTSPNKKAMKKKESALARLKKQLEKSPQKRPGKKISKTMEHVVAASILKSFSKILHHLIILKKNAPPTSRLIDKFCAPELIKSKLKKIWT